MCYKGTCYLWRPPVENGCLVLAILIMVANGLLLLACIITGSLMAAGIIFTSPTPDPAESSVSHILGDVLLSMVNLAAGVALSIVGVGSLISFIFSMLLCNGICNRRPGQVKSYFIYGVVITVLNVVFSILVIADMPTYGILGLVGCVIYSLFLVLVHKTYTKLCAGAGTKDHFRLEEDYPCEKC